ncbi:BID domain-containing T4SS effector [Bartonella taylorii]|uniref:BID domain-containing T4SS effector n=1 Tax=Bartonella taylorii TaxID=33046 RepID=UPI001ABA603C|nr:BID domain-containing T4SS effector [Bartonella taylorii]
MKKKQPSPFVARMIEEFEKNHEQSIGTPANPAVAQNTPKPPLKKRPEKIIPARVTSPKISHGSDKAQSNTITQDSQAQHVRVPPQRPPRARDRELNNSTATQDSQAQHVRVPPQRPPRARDRELNNSTATQDSQAQHVRVPPQKPPRARDRELNNSTATKEGGPIYAEIDIKTPPPTKNREKRNTITQKERTIYTTVAPSKVSTSIPKEEFIQKIRNNILVQGCKDEIKSLSQTVYGNPDIFQTKLEEIEKNPSLGTSLSWQVATSPKLVANLAGKKVLGLKNQARKEAEKNISSLCFAIENYAESVKQAKENALHGHRAEQIRHKHSLDLKQMAEDLQKPRKPEQTPLSHKELAHRVKNNTVVQYCYAEIIYWCTVVYGNPTILQYRLEEIQKSPAIGEELAWQVKTHPHSFGKLSGYNIYGFKNDARTQAENALTHLGEAIEGYAEAIKHAKEQIIQSEEEKHKRHAQPPEQEKSVQRQQSLSKPPKYPEHSPTNRHQEAVETAMQTEWNRLGTRPRTVTTPEKTDVQHRQESVLPTSDTKQKRHTQPPEQEKNVQRQQNLSKPPKHLERSPADRHQAAVETAMQAEWNRLGARPRTVTTPEKTDVQHKQESVLPTSYAEEKEQTTEQEKIPPLSYKEISDRVHNDHSVQRAQIEIYNWCNIVYKDPFVLQYNTEDVQKIPVLGEELSWQVANQPTMFAPLAGKQVLGIKNQARKYAEGAVPSLCAAIDDYTKTVKKVRDEIVKTHQEQSPERDKSMQKQKNLSQSPQLSERSSVKRHPESAENSTQVYKSSPDVHRRKVNTSKTMALTS